MSKPQWPVSVAANHYQFSYRIIETGGKTQHTTTTLAEAIRVAGEAVKSVVWTGWSMFHQFSRKEIAPRNVLDKSTGEEVEAIETTLLGETFIDTTVPDYWRITVDGRATILRPYREDRAVIPHLKSKGLVPGAWLSPRTLVREVYEFATHAKELAKALAYADRIEFRCSWYGLKGRKVADFQAGVDWNERTCHANERTTGTAVSVDGLAADTASVVAELAAPVLRLFGGLEIDREWILSEVPKFRML